MHGRRGTTPAQLELAIEHAPPKVRRHGLRDAHSWPLVSRGKSADGRFRPAFRVSPKRAWRYPEVEVRAANSFPVILLDVDGHVGTQRLVAALATGTLPAANWMVTRRASGGTHAAWTLKRPVHRGARARAAPLAALARISEYFAEVVDADRGYPAVLTHNPMAAAHGSGMVTSWGRCEPYELRELAQIVPFGWKRPKVSRTGIGRNADLFRAGCRWAGQAANARYDVLPALLAVNRDLDNPLPYAEVAGIVRSVERYRRQWEARGWHCPRWLARQAARGRMGGRPRRYQREQEPWTLEGISRASWYRRRETKANTG